MDVLIMCVGNRESGDDGVGPYVADQFITKNPDFVVLDCGMFPENYTAVVKRHHPKTLILVDAAKMGLAAGEIRMIPKGKISVMHMSTHGIPIPVILQYLEQYVGAVMLIGIQPQRMQGKMSAVVKKSGDCVVALLKDRKVAFVQKLV